MYRYPNTINQRCYLRYDQVPFYLTADYLSFYTGTASFIGELDIEVYHGFAIT